MRLSFVLFFLSAVYIVTGVFFSRIDLAGTRLAGEPTGRYNFYDYSGVLNVHSNKSSGSGKVQDIITAASAADLDFIVFNETNPIGQQQPEPIKYGDLSVFYGTELSYKNSRFLHFADEQAPVFGSHSEAQIYVSNFLETGGDGLMILSHPDRKGYAWNKKHLPRYMTGLEVLNLREIWRNAWRRRKLSFIGALIFYPFNPKLFFLDIYSNEALSVARWDDWSQRRPVVGYVGSDATSKFRMTKKFSLNFPTYKSIFQMAKNHIVLKDELTGIGDQERLIEALGLGSSYFSIDILGNPEGFAFWAVSKTGQTVMMGESLSLEDSVSINIVLPNTKRRLEVDLYRNGEVVKTFNAGTHFKPDAPGVYRLVVKANPLFPLLRDQKWIPWIFSNPIHILGSQS